AVRWPGAGRGREGPARPYSWRSYIRAGQAAAGDVFGRGSRGGLCRLRHGAGQTGGLTARFFETLTPARGLTISLAVAASFIAAVFFAKNGRLGGLVRRKAPVANERLMANTSSARKATRKIARKTEVNKARRTLLRNSVRKVEEAIASGDAKV